MKYLNVAHYKYMNFDNPVQVKHRLETLFGGGDIKGTVLLAREGFNLHFAGPEDLLMSKLNQWFEEIGLSEERIHKSYSVKIPFRKFKITLKREICTTPVPEIDPRTEGADYISPKELKEALDNPEHDYVLLDNRNLFETKVGTFKGAIPAGTEAFSEFKQVPERLKQQYDEDQKIVMFCTGGIRCEKVSAYMKQAGFNNVRQLDGGILRYFEDVGGEHFQGNCFVFDERWEIDTELQEASKLDQPPKVAEQETEKSYKV